MAVTERNGETLYGSAVPTDLYPNALTGDSAPIHAARVGLEAVAATVGHISEFETKMDLKRNPHLSADVFKAAVPVLEKAGVTVLRTLEQLNSQRNTTIAAIESALKEKHPLLGPEIRAHIKTAKSPFSEAGNAIREGDQITAAAIFAAPARVSGLTNDQLGQLREMAALQFAGETQKLLDETNKAILRVERANEFITDFTRKKKLAWNHSSEATKKLSELMAKDNSGDQGRPQI